MKKLIVSVCAMAALCLSASAQEKREMKHHGQMKHQHGMMAKQLNFSEDQKKQAKANKAEFRKKMQELNTNENITVKEFRDKKYALRKEQKSKMQAMLTAEQKTKLAQLKAGEKANKEQHFAKHLDKMKAKLALSDQQIASLKAQREAMRTKMMAIKENETLSREQRKNQMMALRAEAKEQHKKIFTADQLKKMEELKKQHQERNPAK